MRPRTELALGATALVLLGIGAAALGSRRARIDDSDTRRSTYLFGPSGASGFADALARLGVTVVRYRRPVSLLDTAEPDSEAVIAFLGPNFDLSPAEGAEIARLPADLLLAGRSAGTAIRCLGYDVVPWRGDPVAVRRPSGTDSLPVPRVGALLRRRTTRTLVDSSEAADSRVISCTAPMPQRIDTVLTSAGRPVVLRLDLEGGRAVTLVSDDRLFANRAVRQTAAGELALELVVPRYRRLIVDEYHHGFDASGSLAGATLDWTLHSPWGWALWQLVAVGILALLAEGVRFGPARQAIERRRRSPLEHVHALATALAASRGHDVAVRLIVQGLRRRLGRSGRATGGELGGWLASLAPSVRTPRGEDALHRLADITARRAAADEVLVAADDAETLWEELKP